MPRPGDWNGWHHKDYKARFQGKNRIRGSKLLQCGLMKAAYKGGKRTRENERTHPEFKKSMASIYQPIMYQDTKEWTVFLKKAYDDYGALIKDLDIKI